MMRDAILRDFPHTVDFEPYDRKVYTARVVDAAASSDREIVLGGTQEDFLALHRAGVLADMEHMWPELFGRAFMPSVAAQSRIGTDRAYFIPWMQATYIMAANKAALRYLPKGARLSRLSYEELEQWASNMYRATGKGRLAFPVGPKGLMHRFLQGFLYPSFTGSMTEAFVGQPALAMWNYLRDLWRFVAPSSLTFNRMDEALLSGEVWVVWDHTARLLEAFRTQPDTFVAFPAPVGPKGRGFITALAGLGRPKGSHGPAAAALIEFLTRPRVQVITMESVGFLPVVEIDKSAVLSPGLAAIVKAATEQLGSSDAILNSIPSRPADAARRFDLVYTVAFSRIVLRGMSVQGVLDRQAGLLREVETGPGAEGKP